MEFPWDVERHLPDFVRVRKVMMRSTEFSAIWKRPSVLSVSGKSGVPLLVLDPRRISFEWVHVNDRSRWGEENLV